MYSPGTIRLNGTLLLSLLLLASCGGGGAIVGGETADSAANTSPVFAISGAVPAGHCSGNGITVGTGVDANGNGVLDFSEISGSQHSRPKQLMTLDHPKV